MFHLIGQALAQAGTAAGSVAAPAIPPITTLTFGGAVQFVINIALYVGGGIAVIYLIYGGITYVTAGGDQEKATQARTIIVNAIIGIIIIALALVMVTWATGALRSGASNTTGSGPLSF
jgi:hypothetical protein